MTYLWQGSKGPLLPPPYHVSPATASPTLPMPVALTPLQAAELVLFRAELHELQESLKTLSVFNRDVADYALLRKGVPALRREVTRLQLERVREAATIDFVHSSEPEACPLGPVTPDSEEVDTSSMHRSSPSTSAFTPSTLQPPSADVGEKRRSEAAPRTSKARKVTFAEA